MNYIKYNDIISGRELFRAEPLHRKTTATKRKRDLKVLSAAYAISAILISCFVFKADIFNIVFVAFLVMFVCLYGIFWIVWHHVTVRGRPFVITSKGVVIEGMAANYFSDIDTYSWEERKWLPGKNVFSIEQGICLRISLKSLWERLFSQWIDGRGYSIMANHLIFFTPEQIAQVDQIFKEHGVRKEE